MALVTPEYAKSLSNIHLSNKGWGNSVLKYAAGDVQGMLNSHPYIRTVLDYGCGKGALKVALAASHPHVNVAEYDPGIPGKDVLPKGEFDLVFSCDVLEHVERDKIDEVIYTLGRKTKVLLYNNIACYSANATFREGPYAGRDIHLIIRPPDWWAEAFEFNLNDSKLSLLERRDIWRRHHRGPRSRCTLIYERVG